MEDQKPEPRYLTIEALDKKTTSTFILPSSIGSATPMQVDITVLPAMDYFGTMPPAPDRDARGNVITLTEEQAEKWNDWYTFIITRSVTKPALTAENVSRLGLDKQPLADAIVALHNRGWGEPGADAPFPSSDHEDDTAGSQEETKTPG